MADTQTSEKRPGRKRTRRLPRKPVPPDSGKIIEEIYNAPDTRDDEPLKIESSKTRSVRPLVITIIILAVLIGSSAVGFFTFNRRTHFNEKGVSVTVEVPRNVASAGEATFTYVVTNDEAVSIRNVELSVSAPDGWTIKNSDPQPHDVNNTLWQLGTISARATRSVRVTGTLVGEVGTVKTFNAAVTYRPSNFNYDFTSRASGSITIGSSIVSLETTGPTEVTPNTAVIYTARFTNSSSDTLEGIRITATYPEGFTLTSSDPKPAQGNNVWAFNTITSGAGGDVKLSGSFSSETGSSQQLLFVAELKRGSHYEKQVENSLVVLLVASGLTLKLSVDTGQPDRVAVPGQSLPYTISYSNDSDLDLENVVIAMTLEGGSFDVTSFSDDFGRKLHDGKVTWDKAVVPSLASVKPRDAGTIRATVKIVKQPVSSKDSGGPLIRAHATASLGEEKAVNGTTATVTTERVTIKIVSKATLSVDPRYFGDDGEQLGSGPLPPVAGKTTSYRVSWFLGNTTNELKEVKVQTRVPRAVYWTGRKTITSAGDIAFDATSRTITWTLNRLPAGVGQEASTISASFELSLTPSSEQVGSLVTLLETSTFSASDSFTGTTLTVTAPEQTTELPNDPKGVGKGVVVSSAE